MSLWVNSSGQIIVDGDGAPIVCDDCPCDGETIDPCDVGFVESDYELELQISDGTYESECAFGGCDSQLEATFSLTWDGGTSRWVYTANIVTSCGSTAGKPLRLTGRVACDGDNLTFTADSVLGADSPGTDTFCSGWEGTNAFGASRPTINAWYDLTVTGSANNPADHADITCPCIVVLPVSTIRARFLLA
jgi:hypothetical protein